MKIKVRKFLKIELIMEKKKKKKLEQNLDNIMQIIIQNNQVFYLYNYLIRNKEIDNGWETHD